MKKKGLLMILSLVISISMFTVPAFADPWKDESGHGKHSRQKVNWFQNQQKQAIKFKFKDTGRHWARYDIEKVQSLGLINGYPDRTFKPGSSITGVEAVAIAIRLADSVYGDIDVNDDIDEFNFNGVPGWAKDAVRKACVLNIINSNRFHSHVQASRAQVAVMLARAMGLEPVDTSHIPFKDRLLISREDLGYIMALYREGLIKGTPNGKFNPNNCITRAELAAILSRIVDYLEGREPGQEEEEVADIIAGSIEKLANDEDNEDDWEIELEDGEAYEVDEDVQVYDEDGDNIDFWDLNEDDNDVVVLYLDDEDTVKEIYLADTCEGVINELDDDEIKIEDETFDLSSDIDTGEYIIGSEVVVYVHSDEVVKIVVLEEEDDIVVPGEIYDVYEDDWQIQIEQDNGNRFTFNVDEDVEIKDEDGYSWDFNDLEKGWKVELELEDNQVQEINILDGVTGVYEGVIEYIDEDEITVNGHTFDLVDHLDIEDFIIGSEVRVYVSNHEVEDIDVTNDANYITVPGEVTDVNDEDWEIIIEQDNGNEFSFDVYEYADIDEVEAFDEIEEGWEVELELYKGKVYEINVTDM